MTPSSTSPSISLTPALPIDRVGKVGTKRSRSLELSCPVELKVRKFFRDELASWSPIKPNIEQGQPEDELKKTPSLIHHLSRHVSTCPPMKQFSALESSTCPNTCKHQNESAFTWTTRQENRKRPNSDSLLTEFDGQRNKKRCVRATSESAADEEDCAMVEVSAHLARLTLSEPNLTAPAGADGEAMPVAPDVSRASSGRLWLHG